MPRPKRQGIQDSKFDDPLSNYSEPSYEDKMQQSLCQSPITDMKHQPFTAVACDTLIGQVMQQMVTLNIACVLVTRQEKLVGIFSERDVLDKVADRYDKLKNQPVSIVMTADPIVVHTTDSPAKALAIMADGGFRHIPILNIDEKVIGIVGPRRINTYLRAHIADS